VNRLNLICRTALPLLLSLPFAAHAQEAPAFQPPPPPPAPAPAPVPAAPVTANADAEPVEVQFSSDQLVYDDQADVVTASGEVRMTREGYHLAANSVTWNRRSGQVRAEGSVRIINPGGDVAYGDSVQLEDTLKDGVVENMLIVLADGGRLAAIHAVRRPGSDSAR